METGSLNFVGKHTLTQLKILSEITSLCVSHKLEIWLRGGWAIDFLLGKVTREHSDIDLVSLIPYRPIIEQILVKAGYTSIPVSEFQTDYMKENIDISFVFVIKSDDGKVIANGFPEWQWRADSLSSSPITLHGITATVLSPHQLLEEKEVYESGTGRKLRPKDYESMRIIRGIIGDRS
jgi:hypothetical protein